MGLNSPRINATVSGTTTATALTAEELNVTGATTTLATTNTVISDKLIELANGTSGTPSGDAGIIIERGSSTNIFIGFDESRDECVIATTSATGASTGDLTFTPANLSVERIGCGTEQAEAEVHAKRDTASGVQYSTTATVICEDDARPSIQIAGGASNIGLIQFGDNAAVASGQVYYDHSTDKLRIDCGGNGDRLTLDANGDLVLAGGITATTGGECVFNTVKFNSTTADESVSGITATFTAGEALNRGDVVYYKAGDSKMWKVNMTVGNAAAIPAVAMAAADIAENASGTFLLQGFIQDAGTFATFAVAARLYAPEAAGGPTATAPSTDGDLVQVIGWSTTADSMYFNPSPDYIEVA
jgi:hypothetical protein